MELSRPMRIARDALAIFVTGIFMFPIFWWALSSIKTVSDMFDKDRIVWFDFTPTVLNYMVTLFGYSKPGAGIVIGTAGENSYDSRRTMVESLVISLGATALTIFIAVLAAYALSRMAFRGRNLFLNWVLGQRFMPAIAILIPIVIMFRDTGLIDQSFLHLGPIRINMGYVGLMLLYSLINLPIAVLLMKSFFDDVPKDVDEAAMIDGASRWQCFYKIVFPMVRGGVAATAVLVFVFSWTEFLLSLFLTTEIRTVPVKIQTFVTSAGNEWGFITAVGTAAMVPSFIFILLVQRHLVRGLTLGSLKE